MDSDLRSVMRSREEALKEVEKLVNHTGSVERKYTEKVIIMKFSKHTKTAE